MQFLVDHQRPSKDVCQAVIEKTAQKRLLVPGSQWLQGRSRKFGEWQNTSTPCSPLPSQLPCWQRLTRVERKMVRVYQRLSRPRPSIFRKPKESASRHQDACHRSGADLEVP